MATDIVQSLFGVTPQAYQQAQQDRMDAQALQYARLDPFQQANFAIGRGASGLATAIGGALGGQDPELQRITMRQQIAGQIDYNDEASMKRGIAALAQSDPQGAMQLQQILLSQQAKRASIAKDEAAGKASLAAAGRERLQGIPNDIQLAREISSLQEQISQFTALPASPERDQALRIASGQLAELQRLTTKEIKDPRFGTDREAIAEEVYGAPFAGLTKEQKAVVNKRVEEEQGKKAKAGATVVALPGVKGAGDLVKLRGDINTTLKPYRDAVNAADQAIALADDVLLTGNFASSASLARSLAKASGETQLSKADVAAFGGDPSLVGSVYDIATRLATGTPTADTTRKLKSLAVLLKKKNESLEKTEIKQLQKTAELSELYTPKQIKELFTLRGETKGTTRKTAGGVSYTVED